MHSNNQKILIQNSNYVTDYFDYWPSFHDDKVDTFNVDKNASTIRMTIHSIQKDKECFVEFLFDKISGLKTYDIDQKNIIFGLEFKKLDDGIKVILDASTGFACEFLCQKITVVNLKSNEE